MFEQKMCISTISNYNYKCINCGYPIKELYKKYSPTVLKLTTCDNCILVGDKYVEYDPIIIIIDLVLLSREAYRHVLFNTPFAMHWKLALIILLIEAYSEWVMTSPITNKSDIANKKDVILEDFQSGDMEFYNNCIKVIFRTLTYLVVIFLLTIAYNRINEKQRPLKQCLLYLWKCITLSSIGVFLFLPSLIWDGNDIREIHIIFVTLYTTLSQLLAYTVICECSKVWSIFVIIISYLCKSKYLDIFNATLNNNYISILPENCSKCD